MYLLNKGRPVTVVVRSVAHESAQDEIGKGTQKRLKSSTLVTISHTVFSVAQRTR